MQPVVIDKPYQFIPPYHGRFWAWVLRSIVPWYLDRSFGITSIQCVGEDKLRGSIRAGHGVLLAANHCRDADPPLMGELARRVGAPFFMMASWHVFMQGRFMRWALQRGGAFSIYREGMDKSALTAATEILENAQRPLVIFPEGVISRTNDRLNSLMEGTALIARSAAKKRAKLDPPGKVVVHPVALRYRFKGEVNVAAGKVLEEIEHRLSWQPQRHLQLVDRIYKVGAALLALKEVEHMGSAQAGAIPQRMERLIDHLLVPLEAEWTKGQREEKTIGRVKKLRAAILPDMVKGEIAEEERQRRWRQLAEMYLAQQLSNYPADYLRANPSPERILETVERFEEDLTDCVRPHRPMSATITVGDAIEVAERQDAEELMGKVEQSLKRMLAIG